MSHAEDRYQEIVAELDCCEDQPTETLHHAVRMDGACMWVYACGREPLWTGDDRVDRELIAPICAGCPVQRECLEFEFRTAGHGTSSVWGPLAAEDRRAAYLVWLDRRDGGRA